MGGLTHPPTEGRKKGKERSSIATTQRLKGEKKKRKRSSLPLYREEKRGGSVLITSKEKGNEGREGYSQLLTYPVR